MVGGGQQSYITDIRNTFSNYLGQGGAHGRGNQMNEMHAMKQNDEK